MQWLTLANALLVALATAVLLLLAPERLRDGVVLVPAAQPADAHKLSE